MAVTWLLGPAGDLRELETPETGMEITEVRFGGVHQALSGARVMDVTGVKSQYTLTFNYLDEEDYRWLQALHTRHIPGPHRLINPMMKNRLTRYAASVDGYRKQQRAVMTTAGLWDYQNDFPTGVLGRRSYRWYNRSGTSVLRFDFDRKTTVFPGESLTGSVYLKGNAGFDMTMVFDWYDQYGNTVSSSTTEIVSVTTSWARYSLTRTVPAGAHLGVFAIYSTATTEVRVAAPQVEAGSVLTAWDQGGADTMVLIDQMPASSPRYPLMNCSLTLLEA